MSDPLEPLLEAIGNVESAKGYNIEFGNKDIPLDQMTLEEVLQHQQNRRQQGAKSSAVGRYQFIYSTLEDIVRRNPRDMPKDAKFDKDMQDKAAKILLGRIGVEDFQNGKMTKAEFAKKLSQKWASFPNPATGKSYYDGDGLNHSLIGMQDVMDVLDAISPAPNTRGRAIPASYKKP